MFLPPEYEDISSDEESNEFTAEKGKTKLFPVKAHQLGVLGCGEEGGAEDVYVKFCFCDGMCSTEDDSDAHTSSSPSAHDSSAGSSSSSNSSSSISSTTNSSPSNSSPTNSSPSNSSSSLQISATAKKKPQSEEKQFPCPECSRIFRHRNSRAYHMRTHAQDRSYVCVDCGKSFFSSSALKVHFLIHTGEKPFKCTHCGQEFRQSGDLKDHVISIHTKVKDHQCEYCGKVFARKYSLTVHRRIHTGEREYKCDFCDKDFRAASYLQHHRRIHTGEKPHSCPVCGKPFRTRSDMNRHVGSHKPGRLENLCASSGGEGMNVENATSDELMAAEGLSNLQSVQSSCVQMFDVSVPSTPIEAFVELPGVIMSEECDEVIIGDLIDSSAINIETEDGVVHETFYILASFCVAEIYQVD